jgi:Tripartite tricarboxylate transporter family receptor
VHVPYKGAAPALQDLIAGRVPMMFDIVPFALQHIQDGSVRGLAVAAPERVAVLPDIPTMAEARLSGCPGRRLVRAVCARWNAAQRHRPPEQGRPRGVQCARCAPAARAARRRFRAGDARGAWRTCRGRYRALGEGDSRGGHQARVDSGMAFAIKAEVRNPRARTFTFVAQKTMYGGKRVAAGDTVFVFASENEGGQGLIARGGVTSAEPVAKKRGIARQTPQVSLSIKRTALARRPLGRREHLTDWNDGKPREPSSTSSSIVGRRTRSSAFRRKLRRSWPRFSQRHRGGAL